MRINEECVRINEDKDLLEYHRAEAKLKDYEFVILDLPDGFQGDPDRDAWAYSTLSRYEIWLQPKKEFWVNTV